MKAAALASARPVPELLKLYAALEQQRNEILGFIARRDALVVQSACAGLGTDDNTLIQIVCNRTKSQLKALDAACPSQRRLADWLKSELSGNYLEFMLYLTESRAEYNG
jgi:hypothetical protein